MAVPGPNQQIEQGDGIGPTRYSDHGCPRGQAQARHMTAENLGERHISKLNESCYVNVVPLGSILAGAPFPAPRPLEGCSMFPAARLHLKKLILWAAPLAGLACGGDGGTNIVLPALSITTATSGVEIDPDGYSVSIDGQAGQPMASNATLTVERLAEGQHTVELADLAPNCSALDNPRTVTVSTGVTATAAFAVTCGASSGTIAVTTTTSGTGSDPDGFSLTLDGADRGSIGVNATANLAGITTGAHLVGLTGLAANCQISDDNPRSVTVTPGQAAEVSFAVICASPAPNSGTLQITTTTGGANLDPDGYSVSVEGAAASQPIAVNATLSIVNVSVGPHAVQLLGLATNCTVAGANPRQATVPAGGTVTMAFEITCVPPPAGTGRVQITTATTGSSIDPDGYTVTLDGGNAQAITVNDTLTFDNLAPGPHSVQLSGMAAKLHGVGRQPPDGRSHGWADRNGRVRHHLRHPSARYRKCEDHCCHHGQRARPRRLHGDGTGQYRAVAWDQWQCDRRQPYRRVALGTAERSGAQLHGRWKQPTRSDDRSRTDGDGRVHHHVRRPSTRYRKCEHHCRYHG